VTELLNRGHSVRILTRDPQRALRQFGDRVAMVQGDITDAERVQEAVEGVTTVYHLAGRLYHPCVPARLYHQTHVGGTRTLLEACRGMTLLNRIVHVSTTGVHGVTGDTPAAEDAPLAPTNPYEATKLEAELLALKAYGEHGLPVTVVRPGLVYGSGDLHLLGFIGAIDKRVFRVIDGGKALLHPVYIDDLIAALLLSAERSQAIGRTYNIAGARPVSVRELARAIAQALHTELAAGSIPLWLANLAADVFAVTPGLSGERAPLTRSRVDFLTRSRVYDIGRARAELGYSPQVDLEEGMKLTAAWYHAKRWAA